MGGRHSVFVDPELGGNRRRVPRETPPSSVSSGNDSRGSRFLNDLSYTGKSYLVNIRVVLVGESAVGKTSIILQFVRDEFREFQESTIGASFLTSDVRLPSSIQVHMDLWDTAGQERYRSLAPMYYRRADVICVVTTITSADAFEHAKLWHREVSRQGPGDVSIFLVANKLDLEHDRKVTLRAMQDWAEPLNVPVFQTSAKTGAGIKELFQSVAQTYVDLHSHQIEEMMMEEGTDVIGVLRDKVSSDRTPFDCSYRDRFCVRRRAQVFLRVSDILFRVSWLKRDRIPYRDVEEVLISSSQSLVKIRYRRKSVETNVIVSPQSGSFEMFSHRLALVRELESRVVEVESFSLCLKESFEFLCSSMRSHETPYDDLCSLLQARAMDDLVLDVRSFPVKNYLRSLMNCVGLVPLRVVDLRSTGIGDREMAVLRETMPSSVEVLNLLLNPDIGLKGAIMLSALASDPSCSLKSVNLCRTGIGSDGVRVLCRALIANSRTLEFLDLSDVQLTEEALSNLCEVVSSRLLKRLVLEGVRCPGLERIRELAVEGQEIVLDSSVSQVEESRSQPSVNVPVSESPVTSVSQPRPRHILDPNTVEILSIELGRGAFGVVKKGKMQVGLLDFDVAVKKGLLDRTQRSQVEKEVILMSETSHKNVLKCFGCWFDDEISYVVFEYCDTDVASWCSELRSSSELTHKVLLRLLLEIATGLEYLHSRSIIHRDVKPDNVLVRDGHVKICDFGVSRHDGSISDTICGTVGFIPNPQHPGDPRKIDVYAFAILAYEIWSGKKAYADEIARFPNAVDLLAHVHSNQLRPDLDVVNMPSDLRDLLKECWSDLPSNRPFFVDVGRRLQMISEDV